MSRLSVRSQLRTRFGVICALALSPILLVPALAAPAQAAVPDVFGYVLATSTGAVVPSGTTPAATTVTHTGLGVYDVLFPGQAGKGVAHVTAVNPGPVWCQIASYAPSGPDETVRVLCFKASGGAIDSGFSAIYDSSTGLAPGPGVFGYVSATVPGGLSTTYNSVGAPNSVVHGSTGHWQVTLAGLSTASGLAGSWQVTALNKIPSHCKIMSWTSGPSQVAQVTCYDPTGAFFDTPFNLSFQSLRSLYGAVNPPKAFGYFFSGIPAGATPTNYNNPLGGSANTLAGAGPWLVTFPQLAALPDDIQVTAEGQSPDFCNLNTNWTHSGADTLVRDVVCYTPAGAISNSQFLISDNTIA
ncbi:MAG: hypothetical protein M3Y42_00950 [Actinomycetota bacterium]|nr:hypothetical protein [Actinomycetota bacterium]